jgi:hypothetical protein
MISKETLLLLTGIQLVAFIENSTFIKFYYFWLNLTQVFQYLQKRPLQNMLLLTLKGIRMFEEENCMIS